MGVCCAAQSANFPLGPRRPSRIRPTDATGDIASLWTGWVGGAHCSSRERTIVPYADASSSSEHRRLVPCHPPVTPSRSTASGRMSVSDAPATSWKSIHSPPPIEMGSRANWTRCLSAKPGFSRTASSCGPVSPDRPTFSTRGRGGPPLGCSWATTTGAPVFPLVSSAMRCRRIRSPSAQSLSARARSTPSARSHRGRSINPSRLRT
jgi:hypothetical protein